MAKQGAEDKVAVDRNVEEALVIDGAASPSSASVIDPDPICMRQLSSTTTPPLSPRLSKEGEGSGNNTSHIQNDAPRERNGTAAAKSTRLALARARLELAAARLALLETEGADDDSAGVDDTGITQYSWSHVTPREAVKITTTTPSTTRESPQPVSITYPCVPATYVTSRVGAPHGANTATIETWRASMAPRATIVAPSEYHVTPYGASKQCNDVTEATPSLHLGEKGNVAQTSAWPVETRRVVEQPRTATATVTSVTVPQYSPQILNATQPSASGTYALANESRPRGAGAWASGSGHATWTPRVDVATSAPAYAPMRHTDDSQQSLGDLAAAILEVARGGHPATKRYCVDLPIFSGIASDWLYFKAAFLESAPSYSEADNMARLRKCLKGVAMESVKCLFLGYTRSDEIIKKLEARFGRPNALITFELDKLRHLPRLTDNPKDVCVFASKVSNIIATVLALNKPEFLYSPEMLNVVVDKLTPIMKSRWYDFELLCHAAARTHSVCLNDFLLTGPDLLQSLLGVLMRFRQKPVAVAADIKDMFLRIKIREEDRNALRFLWRDDTTHTPTIFRMKSLLFGATSSPCTAIYIKDYNAHVYSKEYPQALDPIIKNHYMDDYLQSFSNAEEANAVSRAVDAVHRRGNFVLQRWASNVPAAVADLASESTATNTLLNKQEKVLGLIWHTANDTLGFNFRKVDPSYLNAHITRRTLLKTAMSLYDPLGLATPVTTQAKRILQDTWRLKLNWDEYLPESLEKKWVKWVSALNTFKDISLPRAYPGYHNAFKLELHVFVDASEHTYAAAAYWRLTDKQGHVTVSLAAAKGRVAPIKIVSIPRLELQAAVLGGRLARTVEKEHDRQADRRVFWSDSRTVLSWLKAGACSFKPFVAHRIAELEETTAGSEWRWVPTAHNTADDATRDVALDFSATHRWFCGPQFLHHDELKWPCDHEPLINTITGEERTHVTVVATKAHLIEALPDATRFSSWLRLIRTTARVILFIERCRAHTSLITRKRTCHNPNKDPLWTPIRPKAPPVWPKTKTPSYSNTYSSYVPLAAQYTRRAELLWIRALQQESFGEELLNVSNGKQVSINSRLRRLSLVIDDRNILRLRSRIAATTDITQETLSPAILDGNHYYCRLYIDWVHRNMHHGGVECVANEIRQRYWVLRLRPTVRGVIKRCQPCRLRRAMPPEPMTGSLPPCRLAHHHRPFTHTGLDYFGPLTVTVARRHEKRYVALFTCLTSRAVHLEVAASLSADAAVLALRRMMARRGCPVSIYSDNGTNFHGADKELRDAALKSIAQEADMRHIEWHYIPPGAPFMGGAWERLVRSVKKALTATLKDRYPYEDVLHTLLTEIEHTINSRPLSHVSIAPEDKEALTPNHFLLGGPSKVPLPGTFTKVDEMGRSHWRASQRLADLFWQRWVREVLPMLQNRREPRGHGEVKNGDVVIIVDSNLPRNVWPKGRVEHVYPGSDGVVRVVDVKTKSGVMRRPVKRLVVLPIETIK